MIRRIIKREEIKIILQMFSSRLVSLQKGEDYIENMAEKFEKYSIFLALIDNGKLIAFSAFYCNDKISHSAFLSMIAVSDSHEGKGYGKEMLAEVIKICIANEMYVLSLEVNKDNRNAINFYIRNGFTIVEKRNESSYFMSRTLRTVGG